MTSRKLLPYEHQLADALGLTKEQYLDFIAQQHVYSDVKEGTVLDARNDTTAIVLFVVGLILQAVSYFLSPSPDKPVANKQNRDNVFAPRSGFNSTQQLASYGDPINLIYANIRSDGRGGVRANTALLWSSMKSFGSSQYIQMLLLLGAGGIGRIDQKRTAFGQTPIRDLTSQNYWLYFKENKTGAIVKGDLFEGSSEGNDPGAIGGNSTNIYRVFEANSNSLLTDGFSSTASPSTSNSFGVYAPVPINIRISVRNERGNPVFRFNRITATSLQYWGQNYPDGILGTIEKGETLQIRLAKTEANYDNSVDEEAAELRRAVSAAFDNAAVMKLGSAKFAVTSINTASTEEQDMIVRLICTETGSAPSVTYNESDPGRRPFFTKALVKVEVAKYETTYPCHAVDFAIKAKVWRRISGRQEYYGSDRVFSGYKTSDNGIKGRSGMFLVKYKKTKDVNFNYVQGIFVVSRAADVDNFVYFRFDSGLEGDKNREHWQFEIEPVHDAPAEFHARTLTGPDGKIRFLYLENSGPSIILRASNGTSILFTGRLYEAPDRFPPIDKGPAGTNEWDLFGNNADTQLQLSSDNGPEFTVTAVTELIRTPFSSFPGLYNDLSLMGFNMYSGRNVQDLRSMTIFVEQGRRSRLLRTSGTVNGIEWGSDDFEYLPTEAVVNSGSLVKGTSYYITSLGNTNWQAAGVPIGVTPNVGLVFEAKGMAPGTGQAKAGGYANTAPDIFIDTLLDTNDGIGKYAGDLFSIDLRQLSRSKKFCEKNRLFMEGVIAEPTSWRQFWAENAGYSLLELAKQDGKECLIPAVPYNKSTGAIVRELQISALFTPGNILEDSYKEEFIDYGNSVQDVIVTVIYRDNERDGAFPKNDSVDISLKDAQEENSFRETIDASQFVTERSQAILLGKFLCQTRRNSRRAIEFKTFPTDSFVAPGSFIYVEFSQNQWSNIYSGTIDSEGALNLPFGQSVPTGTYQVLLYNPSKAENTTLYRSNEPVVDGVAEGLRNYKGHVFVLGKAIKSKRVFKVTEVTMDEEGEVTIKGVEHGVDQNGLSLISYGLSGFVPGLFLIDGKDEQQ